ncbi:Eukaryotic translation initiation factor 4 gamma 2 [Desmophyllum pertusum]|uniref:Eukaryotic translation initiation factor 4 gamma 2 n=1 Tax=Desmophyllum pertusum TaxID=174260 RepID=A0A9W9YX34_9CNID|nr:Eukaryotic translation initiation factor 4 gamma 2 [Desmophyllum pertusum]
MVWIIKRSPRLKGKSHILIANLAVADALQSCNTFFMLITIINGVREVVPASLSLQEPDEQQAFQRWVPPQINRLQYRDDEAVFRRVRGILNKLTPDKFEKLCHELLSVGIETKYILKGVILLVFEKALDEPKYSSMYAQLCLRLSEEAPNFDDPGKTGNSTFRRLLLKQCEEEFNNRTKASQAFDKKDGPLTSEEEEQRCNTKRKVLGNIRFIGELAKYDMLHEAIVHKCIKQLLDKKKRATVAEMSESMECLCHLMKTVGPRLDIPKAKSLMDQYFERIQQLLGRSDFPVRIRFMIEDVIDLRNAKWVPRKSAHEVGPKMIQQIRQEAWQQGHGGRSGYPGHAHGHMPRNTPPHAHGNWMNRAMGGGGGGGRMSEPQPSRGMNDVFVTDNGFRPSDTMTMIINQFAPRDQWADLSTKHSSMPSNSTAKPAGGGWRPTAARQNHTSSDGEISLRPAKDSIAASQRPGVTGRSQTPPASKTIGKKVVLNIKFLKTDIDNIVTDFLEAKDVDIATKATKDIKGPSMYLTSLVSQLLTASLDAEDGECFSQLFVSLHKSQLLTADVFIKGVSSILEQHRDTEEDELKVKKQMAQFIAQAVTQEILTLIEMSSLTENGNFYPTLLLCLKELETLKGQEWLVKEFTDSKLDLLSSLPEEDRTNDTFMSILEKQSLVFLFPLLHIQADLYSKIEEDPSVTAIYKWVKDNVDSSWHTNPEFINVLATSLLKYATKDSTLAESVDPSQAPEKDVLEKEKAALKKLLPLVEKFVHEKSGLQVSVLYALQVFSHSQNFPKGMLLRMFVLLYDTEVVEEEAFLRWKEDVSEKHPGKGKALFQVNSWLTWLETADEEGSDSEAE